MFYHQLGGAPTAIPRTSQMGATAEADGAAAAAAEMRRNWRTARPADMGRSYQWGGRRLGLVFGELGKGNWVKRRGHFWHKSLCKGTRLSAPFVSLLRHPYPPPGLVGIVGLGGLAGAQLLTKAVRQQSGGTGRAAVVQVCRCCHP